MTAEFIRIQSVSLCECGDCGAVERNKATGDNGDSGPGPEQTRISEPRVQIATLPLFSLVH